MAQQERVCRVVRQYSRGPVPEEDMKKLMEIAQDCRDVKNYVYARYGGKGSLSKLYPGYTIQNEMTACGLRERLGLPSVYFHRAVADALGDIRTQWTLTKSKVLKLISKNQSLSPQEKHYLRFVLRCGNAFEAVMNGEAAALPAEMQTKYEELASQTDTEKLQRYLHRQVRKYHVRDMHTEAAGGFYATERAYRYGEGPDGYGKEGGGGRKSKDREGGEGGDGNSGKRRDGAYGIYLATKEKRKRVFIPLTDENAYQRQIHIRLKPEESGIEIHIPVETRVRRHHDYGGEIGLSAGMERMFTTDEGKVYGEGYGALHRELTEYLSAAGSAYRREKKNNAGRRKYKAKKARLDGRIGTYVNREINRMLSEEKPGIIYIPKLPQGTCGGYSGKTNHSATLWKRGYIRERLEQKCRENGIELVEVMGKDISRECSRCGAPGRYEKDMFRCGACGLAADKKTNAARNAVKRGRGGQRINRE